jgi:hypothetical protein
MNMLYESLHFVSFGNANRYPKSLARIKKEAQDLGIFENIYVWTEEDLDSQFFEQHRQFMTHTRGYGYYLWKPQVILQALCKTQPGDFLLYADAGCTFNPKYIDRINTYMEMAKQSPKGVFGFNTIEHMEYKWNKMDTMCAVLGKPPSEDILYSPQCVGGINVWYHSPAAIEFLKEWIYHCTRDSYHYVDDSPSIQPNVHGFCQHRHDQAIFSLLVKKYNICTLPDETYHINWESTTWPIHAARIRE